MKVNKDIKSKKLLNGIKKHTRSKLISNKSLINKSEQKKTKREKTKLSLNHLVIGKDQSNSKKVYPQKSELNNLNYTSYCDILSIYNPKVHSFEGDRSPYATYCDNNIFFIRNIKDSFRVMSYNVHNFVNICPKYETKKDITPFIDLIEHVNSDIVCLQEVVPINSISSNIDLQGKNITEDIKNDLNFKKLSDKMESIGYNYNYIIDSNLSYNYNTDESFTCYFPLANTIFSKLELHNIISYILPGSRSLIISHIVFNNLKILIINTHLEYSNNKKDVNKLKKLFNNEKIVNIQIKYLMKLINIEKDKRNVDNIILCGDLNNVESKFTLNLKTMFNEGFDGTYTSKFGEKKIDYILLDNSKNLDIVNQDTIKASYSDHLPIYADFKIKDEINSKIKKFIKYLNFEEDAMYVYDREYMDRRYVTIKVNDSFMKDSHLDLDYWYFKENMKPIIKNKPYDYVKPLVTLYDKFNQNRFLDLIKIANRLPKSEIRYVNNTHDEILYYYLKTRPNFKTIVLYPSTEWYLKSNTHKMNKMLGLLEMSGYVYYKKKILLSYKDAMGLIYQLYLTTNRNKDLAALEYHASAKGWDVKNKKEKKPILVFFYEYKNDQKDITGTEAFFKNKLRHIWQQDTELGIYNILHINDYYSEALDNSGLFLNENSLKILRLQSIKKHLKINNQKKVLFMINTYKKLLLEKFDHIDTMKFVLFGSITLYTLGLRMMNDIDGKLYYEKNASDKFNKQYNKYFTIEGKKYFSFIDIALKGTPRYDDYVDIYGDYLAKMIGANDFNEVIFNPKYHYYFFGIKIPIIQYDIIKRMIRYNYASVTDLIAYNNNLNLKFKIPNIPKSKVYYNKDENGEFKKEIINVDKNKFLNAVIKHFKVKYNFIFSKEKIESFISNVSIEHHLEEAVKNINKNKNIFNEKLKLKYLTY